MTNPYSQIVKDYRPLEDERRERGARARAQAQTDERNSRDIAEQRRLSREQGVPLPVIETNPNAYKRKAQYDALERAVALSASLARWASTGSNGAALVNDAQEAARTAGALDRALRRGRGKADEFEGMSPEQVAAILNRREDAEMAGSNIFWRTLNYNLGRHLPVSFDGRPEVVRARVQQSRPGVAALVSDQLERGSADLAHGLNVLGYVLTPSALAGAKGRAKAQMSATGRVVNAKRAGDKDAFEEITSGDAGRVISTVGREGVRAVPSLLLASARWLGMGASLASNTGNIAESRAQANNTDVGLKDVAIAAPFGAVSALGDKFGADALLGRVVQNVGKNAVRRVAVAGGVGLVGEGVTEGAQSFVEYAGGSLGTDQGFNLAEAGKQALVGGVVGAGVGGTVGGGHRATLESSNAADQALLRASPKYRELRARRAQAAAAAASEAALGDLDTIMDSAAKHELRDADPETFREYLAAQTEGTVAENVYIPVEAVDKYLQTEGADPGFLSDYADQIAEARGLNGEVVVPLADFAARAAGTPIWEALKNDVRTSQATLTRNEMGGLRDRMVADLEARADEILGIAENPTPAAAATPEGEQPAAEPGTPASAPLEQAPELDPAVQVYEEIKAQLAEVGYSRDAATKHAALVAAQREATAKHYGITALEYHRKNPIEFQRAAPGATVSRGAIEQPSAGAAAEGGIAPGSTAPVEGGENPTALTEDTAPLEQQALEPDAATAKIDAKAPGFAAVAPYLTDEERQGLRAASAKKLLDLFESLPDPEELASVAFSGRAKRGWYERSALALLDIFGAQDAPRFAALMAALSPQTSVEANAVNAVKTWVNWDQAGRPTSRREIVKVLGSSVQGGKGEGSVLNAWINNTVAALTTESPHDIVLSGPKVNSFMLNLMGVMDEVTNDTWMANYALIEQTMFSGVRTAQGIKGKSIGYKAYSAFVRKAASILSDRTGETWSPAEVQETVWSWVKTLTEKRMGGLVTAEDILASGLLTADEIGGTPDFATLLTGGVYRRVLEFGGYGEALEAIGGSGWADGPFGSESDPTSDQGSGVAPDTLKAHLAAAARRIDQRVERALAAKRGDPDPAQYTFFQEEYTGALVGLPSVVKVDGVPVEFGPFAPAKRAAARVVEAQGRVYTPPTDYVRVDPERAKRIADAFTEMKHAPHDPEVAAAYAALAEETLAQWEEIKKTGLQVEFITGDDPYGNPRNAILDVAENNHLWVYPTENGFGETLLNVGLKIDATGEMLTRDEVIAAVEAAGGKVLQDAEHVSDTEQTAVIRLAEPLPEDVAYTLSETLRQDAVVQVAHGKGAMIGPKAEAWGDFDPAFFRKLDGSRMTEDDVLGDNPLLAPVEGETISGRPVVVNDIFRIVHDYFGHIAEGVGFRADGEENAWRQHSAMYSPLARKALTTETRGQNSWVNFGPHGASNQKAGPGDTKYAPQKIGLLPDWAVEDGSGVPLYQDAPTVESQTTVEELARFYGAIDTIRVQMGADAIRQTADGTILTNTELPQWLADTRAEELSTATGERIVALAEGTTDPRWDEATDVLLNSPPVDADGMVTLQHYSADDDIDVLDPARWGTSNRLPPSERARVGKAPGRVYFGIATGAPGGYRNEFTGATEYEAKVPLSSLYDIGKDPDGLRKGGEWETAVRDAGYTGYWTKDPRLGLVAVVFTKTPVTRTENRVFAQEDPVFYSALLRFIEETKQGKASAAQWAGILRSAPGIKTEELEFTGVEELLADDPGCVFTREELAEWLDQNQVVVTETVQFSPNDDDEGDTRYRGYALAPGRAPYRELLIQTESAANFDDPHWRAEGVIAHIRFHDTIDAEGRRGMLVEEIQSDIHQKGRKFGYQGVPPSPEALALLDNAKAELAQAQTEFVESVLAKFDDPTSDTLWPGTTRRMGLIRGGLTRGHVVGATTEAREWLVANGAQSLFFDQYRKIETAEEDLNRIERIVDKTYAVPNAPFKNTWTTLALKRAIRWAADNGYDRVSWTLGKDIANAVGGPREALTAFYERNLVNTANAFLKKYKGRVTQRAVGDNARRAGARGAMSEQERVLLRARQAFGSRVTSVEELEGLISRNSAESLDAHIAELEARIAENDAAVPPDYIADTQGWRDTIDGMSDEHRRSIRRIQDNYARVIEDVERLEGFRAEYEAASAEPGTMESTEVALAEGGEIELNPGFDLTPELAAAARAGFALFQPKRKKKKGPRGQVQFKGTTSIITLFENADASTLIHELGHTFFEEMKRNARAKDAPAAIKEDWAKLTQWLADQGQPVINGHITREGHELIARGFERYAMEGNPPSEYLANAFAGFRKWLTSLYKTVVALRSPINAEVRDVFTRWLATENAVEAIREEQAPALLTEKPAEMTEAEFSAYTTTVAAAKNEAYNRLLESVMRSVRARRTADYRAQRNEARTRLAEDINAQPRFRALDLLRGQYKLHRDWVAERFGEDMLSRLPRGVVSKTGNDADQIAEEAGFGSGAQMVEALAALRAEGDALKAQGDRRTVRDKAIADAVDEELDARSARDILKDDEIEAEARETMHTAQQGEVYSAELRALARMGGGSTTPYAVAREWARRRVAGARVQDVASKAAIQQYARAAAKSGRLAEEAYAEGDIPGAYRHKQAQMLNHALVAEARAARAKIETIVNRMSRIAKRSAQKSVDPEYFARVQQLLAAYEFKPMSQKLLDEMESFLEWTAAQGANGYEVLVPPRLVMRGQHYTRADISDLIALDDAVSSLMKLGRLKQKIKDGQEAKELAAYVDEIIANVSQLPDRALTTEINDPDRLGASAVAGLIKIETIAAELDNNNPNGPLTRLLVHRASEAATRQHDLRERVLKPIADAYLSRSAKDRARLEEKVTIPEWLHKGADFDPRSGQPVTMTRMELIAIALNTGNQSNLEKLSAGEGWSIPNIETALARELTRDDWVFVQSVWDAIDSLWPDIAAVEREMSGVVPERVAAREVRTPYGTFRGGYYPVVYDADRAQFAENNAANEANDLFGARSGVSTPKGHTITRTEATGPIRRSVEDVLFSHIDKVTSRIAYAEYARDVMRIINNTKVRSAIDLKLGREYRRQIKPWLQRTVSNRVDHRGLQWWEKFLRGARVNMSVVAMGLRWSTGVAQVAGLTASAGRVGAIPLANAMRELVMSPRATVDFVMSRSPEMARRNTEVNREVAEFFRGIKGNSLIDRARGMAFWHIGMIDRYVVAVPTWLAAYKNATNQGMTDAQASRAGDKAVRMSQGSGQEKDLSNWQSPNSETMRWITLFYTYFNVQLQAQWEAVRAAKRKDFTRAAVLSFWFLMAAPLADALLSGDIPDDEDEEGEGWLKWMGRNIFFNLFSGAPVLRDAANYGERKMRGEFATLGTTPLLRTLDATVKAAETAYKGVQYAKGEEEEPPSRWVKTAIETPGYFVGLPTGQLGATGQFLWDLHTGDVEPQDAGDWYEGLTKGRVKDDER